MNKFLLPLIIVLCVGVGLVFLIIRIKVNSTDVSDTDSPTEQIQDVSFRDCKVTITTNLGEERSVGNLSESCLQNPTYAISPSGKYLVFEDVSGGVDLWVRIFSIETGKTDTLGVWGTSNLFEILFTPNDELVVYNGFIESPSEQTVYVYNIPGLYKNYPETLNDYDYFLYGPYSRELDILEISGDYFSLEHDGLYLYIYGGTKEYPALRGQYTLDEVWPDHF